MRILFTLFFISCFITSCGKNDGVAITQEIPTPKVQENDLSLSVSDEIPSEKIELTFSFTDTNGDLRGPCQITNQSLLTYHQDPLCSDLTITPTATMHELVVHSNLEMSNIDYCLKIEDKQECKNLNP